MPNVLLTAALQQSTALPVPASEGGENPYARKKRKAYSDDGNDTVAQIFGLNDPRILSSTDIDAFLAHHPRLLSKEPYSMAAPKVLLGIEVEVENVLKLDPNCNLLLWTAKNDGSLRNNGMEFVTPGVLPTAYAEPALKLLFDGMNDDVDFSQRTSIHVHMDIRQLTLQQALGLLLTYTAVENLLFKYVGLTRRNNIFCVPITESGLLELVSDNPKRFMWSIDQHWSKYTALNMLPMIQFGSVEFRHMPGTKNIKQVLGWIDLITRLKLHAYKYPLATIVEQISELNGSSRYKQFVDLVFKDAANYLDMSNLLMDMEKPVYIVKNCAASNVFHNNVVRAAKVESQLGDILFGWMSKLSEEQIKALKFLAREWRVRDLEKLFKDLVARTQVYYQAHPLMKDKIDLVLKPQKEEKVLLKDIAFEQMMQQYQQQHQNYWNAIIQNSDEGQA